MMKHHSTASNVLLLTVTYGKQLQQRKKPLVDNKKDSFTLMVAHDAARNMLPPYVNPKGTVLSLCTRFSSFVGGQVRILERTEEMFGMEIAEKQERRGTRANKLSKVDKKTRW